MAIAHAPAVGPGKTIESGYRVDPLRIGRRDGVGVALSGPVHASSIVALLEVLECRGPAFVLIDESELKVGLIGPGDIQRIAHRWSGALKLRGAAIAVVAPNPAVYGLNRMFQLVSNSDPRLAVFWDRATAVAWLDQPD